ncbi:MAG: hypothetical protein HRF42_12830 [Candidatus Brocadia sp.]
MLKNKRTRFRRIVISCGIVLCVALVVILIVPIFISGDFIQRKVTQTLKDRFSYISQVGPVSFHWPNRVNISSLTIQRHGQNKEALIHFENIHSTLRLLPLLLKKIDVKKISIQQINYENRLLIKDLVTYKFSFRDGVVSAHTRLYINEGPATIKGVIDLRQKSPAFDLAFEAKDIYITQDIPALELFPLFTVKGGEVGGILSIVGSLQGKGLGREIVSKKLVADIKLDVRDGYIRGNKLLSSILEILGEKDLYSFDSMETLIRIKDGKVCTQKVDMQGPLMSLNASGMAEFEGSISYDAVVRFNKEHLGKDVKKIAELVLKQNELPIEIRGTTKDPRVAVKLNKENLEHVIKGLVNDFLLNSKKKQEKETN